MLPGVLFRGTEEVYQEGRARQEWISLREGRVDEGTAFLWERRDPWAGERVCVCDKEGIRSGYCQNPLAQTQERILDLLMELGDKHLLLSDLLSLSWFRTCPGIHFKLVGRGPSSQSASYFIVGEASVSVRKDDLVISVGLGS